MDLRDWLIIAGVAIILGILVDGFRRVRLAKNDSLKMSRDMGGHIETSPLDDDYNPELPGSQVRIIERGDDSRLPDADEPLAQTGSVDSEGSFANTSLDASDPVISADFSDKIEPVVDDNLSGSETHQEAEPAVSESVLDTGIRIPAAEASQTANIDYSDAQEHEVIVINVDAKLGEKFSGAAIKTLLEACGMEHGEMSIFHRHEQDDLLSPIQFSVANAVEPGYFDPDKLEEIETPGVSFFMSVPGPKDYIKAFEYMTETARCFAENLKGELKDENRSTLTSQTIEHCRQRIKEFERKQLAKARA